ncbi:MAG: HIT family protein [Candidatus Paceibacterota bacterium]
MEECVFCDPKLKEADVLFETPNFFIKLGIGVAAPGHVMLVSKGHYTCFADMPPGLREEYAGLKNLVFDKIKAAFSEPFLVEYGILEQSVPHAHLHFIPKERRETKYYPGYKIKDLFKEIGVPAVLLRETATWEKAKELRKNFGGYIFMKDRKARLFAALPENFSSKNLSYRRFFCNKFNIADIPLGWKNIADGIKRIDGIKKETTKMFLKF